ncbi:Uncharacterised protein [Salmonella enterica subsp. enterica serovar Typhimurium str. DT104]|nr:Uncharacterised protein [Salmonella enterica subsp. enterica serovar Typhimurium str. DT104]
MLYFSCSGIDTGFGKFDSTITVNAFNLYYRTVHVLLYFHVGIKTHCRFVQIFNVLGRKVFELVHFVSRFVCCWSVKYRYLYTYLTSGIFTIRYKSLNYNSI